MNASRCYDRDRTGEKLGDRGIEAHEDRAIVAHDDRAIVAHDDREIVAHDDRAIVAVNPSSPNQTAHNFRVEIPYKYRCSSL